MAGVSALKARFEATQSASKSSVIPDRSQPSKAAAVASSSQRSPDAGKDESLQDDEPSTPPLQHSGTPMSPSQGAMSMLDPDTMIENPFGDVGDGVGAAGDSRESNGADTSQASPHKTNASDSSTAEDAQPYETSGTGETGSSSPGTSSSAHFSVVSLSSTAAELASGSDSRRQTVQGVDSSKRATPLQLEEDIDEASRTPTKHPEQRLSAHQLHERLRSRAESANNRGSQQGLEKLREEFERLQSRAVKHTRNASSVDDTTEADETAMQEEDEGGASSIDRNGGQEGEEGPDDGVDWDFWGRIMSNYQQVARDYPQDLSRAIQAGIPAQLRGLCWQLLSASKDEEMEIIYAYYMRQPTPHEKQIRKDLSRTFPDQEYFKDVSGTGQESLYHIVKAYSLYDEECGYCQGMQFIVGPLLLNMPDEEAFSTLVRLMKSYGLRGHFVPNMPALQLRLFQFDRLLEDTLPLLHRHLTRHGVKTSMYASQWFMTLFSYRFPLEFVYRVLDAVFAEGIEAIFRYALALMQRSEDVLIGLNFEQSLAYLKGTAIFDVYRAEPSNQDDEIAHDEKGGAEASSSSFNVNLFARDAYSVQISPFTLDGYAAEFDEQVKAANAHRREVEALRLVNRNLAAKVASLEEQLQQISAEHVDLVKQAVMSKIAKEEMEEDLIRYKMLFAEASLRADQAESDNVRRSSAVANDRLQSQSQSQPQSRTQSQQQSVESADVALDAAEPTRMEAESPTRSLSGGSAR